MNSKGKLIKQDIQFYVAISCLLILPKDETAWISLYRNNQKLEIKRENGCYSMSITGRSFKNQYTITEPVLGAFGYDFKDTVFDNANNAFELLTVKDNVLLRFTDGLASFCISKRDGFFAIRRNMKDCNSNWKLYRKRIPFNKTLKTQPVA